MAKNLKQQAPSSGSRRGRPRAGEREQRMNDVLDAVLAELIESGEESVTMLRVAQRAGASKETLYSWFGSRIGLITALIERNADSSAERVQAALAGDGQTDTKQILVGYSVGLLTLLTSPPSIALNRAAMGSPELAETLLAAGRHRVGPVVEDFLAQAHVQGEISAPDPAEAFSLLYGLVMRDSQIRVLLGEPAPSARRIRAQAVDAVDKFFELMTPTT